MTMGLHRLLLPIVLIVSATLSCGGSGSPKAGGGIGGTGISMGKITGFGSVFVNGVEFETDGAVIRVDGVLAEESDLGIGMVVTVEGTFDSNGSTGRADRITYEEAVKGRVDGIDSEGESFLVLGRTILISPETVFEGGNFETLLLGTSVEVGGFVQFGGTIDATRVKFLTELEFEITGVVKNLNVENETFMIENLLVDYGDAIFEGISDGEFQNGLQVEVESQVGIEDGVFIASHIEPQESPVGEEDEGLRVEIEGLVTDFSSLTDFKVNGIPVRTSSQTLYKQGTASNVMLNAKLEIEGTVESDGVLLAEEIEFQVENAFEVQADVQEVDPGNRTLDLLGITIRVNNSTQMRYSSDSKVMSFGMENILVGDRLEVSGIMEGETVIATSVERMNPGSEVSIKGPVTAVTEPALDIFGITAVTTIETEFVGSDGLPISADEFFELVEIGQTIEAEGILTSGEIIIAEEIEFEG